LLRGHGQGPETAGREHTPSGQRGPDGFAVIPSMTSGGKATLPKVNTDLTLRDSHLPIARRLALHYMERRIRRLRRLLVRGLKFGPGNLGRPVQIADDRPRQHDQKQYLDQQDSSDRRPKALAAGWTVIGWRGHGCLPKRVRNDI